MKIEKYFLIYEATKRQLSIDSQAQSFAKKIVSISTTDIDNDAKKKQAESIISGLKGYLTQLETSSLIDIFHKSFNKAVGSHLNTDIAKEADSIINDMFNQKGAVRFSSTEHQVTSNKYKETSPEEKQQEQGKEKVSQKGKEESVPQKTQFEQKPEEKKEPIKRNLINGKDKTLYDTDSLETETFKNDLNEPSESDFLNNVSDYKGEDLRTSNTFKSPDFIKTKAKFPKKYVDLIERMANTKMYSNTEPPITDFISKGGSGKINAQAGEIMTMMFSSMSDDEVKIFSDSLLDHVSKEKDSKMIITKDWVKAALNNRTAIHNMLKSQYKNIKIPEDIAGSVWDTKEDVESLGLENYDANKGFSTDIYIKVKDSEDGYKLEEISLKKDSNVNFLNSGAGIFNTWDDKLKDEINPIKYKDKQKEKLVNGVTKCKDDINKLLESNNSSVKDLKKIIGDDKIDDYLSAKNRKQKKVLKYALEAVSKTNDEAKKDHDDIVNDEREFKKTAIKEITENERMKAGMLSEISKEFPLKSISDGEEKMAIGDMAVNKEVLKHIFGTDNWNNIKEKLVAVGGNKPFIAYKVDAESKEIPIAEIAIREDGVGYGGHFKFEMKLDKRFAKTLKEANFKLYKKVVENFIYNMFENKFNILMEKYL